MCLLVDFRRIGPTEDVVDADAVEIRQDQQRVGGRDAFAALEFRDQRLVDARLHLQSDLSQSPVLAQFAQVVLHIDHHYYSGPDCT